MLELLSLPALYKLLECPYKSPEYKQIVREVIYIKETSIPDEQVNRRRKK